MDCAAQSGNPRGQIMGNRTGPQSLGPGDDRWESWWVLIPPDFPVVDDGNWFVVQEDFGSPFSGSPPVAIDIEADGSGANQFVISWSDQTVPRSGLEDARTRTTAIISCSSQWEHTLTRPWQPDPFRWTPRLSWLLGV